jgi:hypothetical protein
MSQDLNQDDWHAGMTTDLNCSVCGPGTYQPGSGQDARFESRALCFTFQVLLLAMIYSAVLAVRQDLTQTTRPAGLTSCIPCGPGTYQTGTGQDGYGEG